MHKDDDMKTKNSVSNIKSPLRYPGGKSRALKRILSIVPEFGEYREPMVGGGSIFFGIKQAYPNKKYWINDKNTELYLFWKFCRDAPTQLVRRIRKLKKGHLGRHLYEYLKIPASNLTDLERAARFFVLNRVTFSGLVDSGGYSEEAYEKRFTESSIKRVYSASKLLKRVKITNLDYREVVKKDGENVFIFLDPPYFSKTQAKLYGKKGDLHIKFNHEEFFKNMATCKHKCLVTYDDCAKIEGLYKAKDLKNWQKKEWKLQYGTNNLKDKAEATVGNELFLYNYDFPQKTLVL